MNSFRIYFRRLHGLFVMALVILLGVVSCDVLEDDLAPDNAGVKITGKEVYAFTGNSAYINLQGMVKTTAAVRLAITTQPSRGILTELQKGFLRYTPKENFKSGRDSFQFAVYSASENKLLFQDSVIIIVESDSTNLPCGLYPVNDYVYDSAGVSVTVPVLRNDILCADSADIRLQIYRPTAGGPPFQGTAEVINNYFIRYTPAQALQGSDTVIYRVSSRKDTTKVGYGLVVITPRAITPEPPTPPGPPTVPCQWALVNDTLAFSRNVYTSDTLYLPIFKNDTLCSNLLSKYTVKITHAPAFGEVQLNGFNTPRYILKVSKDSYPSDSLVYQVCHEAECKKAFTLIRVTP